jgi:hypothetical protein
MPRPEPRLETGLSLFLFARPDQFTPNSFKTTLFSRELTRTPRSTEKTRGGNTQKKGTFVQNKGRNEQKRGTNSTISASVRSAPEQLHFFSPHIAPLPPVFSPTDPTSRQGTAQSKSETTDKSNIRQNYPPKHFDYRAVSRNFAVMNELSPYLRKLLLEHDCAIIPDFGGFVMQRHAAHHATTDQQMLPPSKTVGFNALLRTEDGLLAHEVCKSRHISYAQAADFVQQCVRDMKRDLMRGLEVKFDGVGCIQLSTDGNYDFRPEPQINLAPEYYFLTPFALKEVPKTEEVKPLETSLTPDGATAELPNSPNVETASREQQFTTADAPHFSRTAYRAFAAMFVIALCFFWSIPLNRNNQFPSTKANTEMFAQLPQMKVVGEVLSSISGEETPPPTQQRLGAEALLDEKETDSVKRQARTSTDTAHVAAEKPQPAEKNTATDEQGGYALILASQTTREGALRLVNHLQQQGYKTARAQVFNGMSRVLVGHFATRQAAKQALAAGRNHNSAFAEAWITKE